MAKQEIGGNQENQELLKEMRLGSGEVVMDRPSSHLHEGVRELLDEALTKINSLGRNFIEAEVDFDREIGKTSLVETNDNDTIVYAQRPPRTGLTRFVKNSEAESCSSLTVVLKKGKQENLPEDFYIIITAYVGHVTPLEPWDKNLLKRPDPDIAIKASQDFWSRHALVYGAESISPETETDVCPW